MLTSAKCRGLGTIKYIFCSCLYILTKFQVSSIIQTSFRRGRVFLPLPSSKRTLKSPIRLWLKGLNQTKTVMLTEFIRSYSKYISSSHFIFYISIIVGSVQKYLRLPVHTINSLSYHERKCLTKLRFGRCSSHWNSISRKIVLLKTSVDHIINSLQLLVMTSKILLDNNKQVFFFFFVPYEYDLKQFVNTCVPGSKLFCST